MLEKKCEKLITKSSSPPMMAYLEYTKLQMRILRKSHCFLTVLTEGPTPVIFRFVLRFCYWPSLHQPLNLSRKICESRKITVIIADHSK